MAGTFGRSRPPRWVGVALVVALLGRAAQGGEGHVTVAPDRIALAGLHEGRQLLVTEDAGDGRTRDLTREARYVASPPGVVRVEGSGYVRAEGAGEATIDVRAGGRVASVRVSVRSGGGGAPHFANDVVPVLTRSGCNAGGCHGKAGGQNGFKLSLLGYDPAFDYDAIVREGRGRRVFPADPGRSLLLLKGSGRVPHGGGRRLEPEGDGFGLLLRWVALGMPAGDPNAPALQAIEVRPRARVLSRAGRQQLAVTARYGDGSVRDVTRQAQYSSNEPALAAVDGDGLVRTLGGTGEAAVMARYQGQVAVFRATVPLEPGPGGTAASGFEAASRLDELAEAKWRSLGLSPSPPCTDAEFLRRASLDLCGRLPAPGEVRAFLDDRAPGKRARLIDRLLDDPDYAAFSAMRWGTLLRNAANTSMKDGSEPAAYAFHDWLKEMIARNRPYDEFVRGIVAASGEWQDAPAVNWYWQMADDPLHQPTADAAQLFLGVRIQCARCHHHPFEAWGQDDYYGLAGFFARVGRKDIGAPAAFFPARATVTSEVHPRTGGPIEPKFLGGPSPKVPPEGDPRQALVDWMARPDNPYFARALCNRVWGHLMGRGLVDPVDDMRVTNPPSNPELLDALARDFVAHGFDVKRLTRAICTSNVYGLSSAPGDRNRHDRQNHARYYPRRLIAEVLLDAVDRACGTKTKFAKIGPSARAVDLPHEAFGSDFLDVFNRPNRSSACECARGVGANLSQVLQLANSEEVEDKVAADDGRVAALVRDGVPAGKAVEELYLATLSRLPVAEEREKSEAHLRGRDGDDLRRGLEDVLWALLNSREFLFNH